jgi:hypothetical protein
LLKVQDKELIMAAFARNLMTMVLSVLLLACNHSSSPTERLPVRTNSDAASQVNRGGSAALGQDDLMEFDFSAELASTTVLPRETSEEVRRFTGIRACMAEANTLEDEMLLGVREVPGIGWWSARSTSVLITAAIMRDGVVPATGVALYPELSTQQGISAFFEMSSQERIQRYVGGVNPVTKRFYAGFPLSSSEPGGICIEPLSQGADGLYMTSEGSVGFTDVNPLYPDPDQEPIRPQGAYIYKINSSDGGEVLCSNIVTYSRDSSN